MSKTIYLDRLDGITASIVRSAYPEYRGKKVCIEIRDYPIDVRSYWDGGSRDYFVFVNLATMERAPVPTQSAFDPKLEGSDSVQLPQGFACVRRSIFCGKDHGIAIMVGSSDIAPMLPAPSAELTPDQETVLVYTRSCKSSYAGKDRCAMAIDDMLSAKRFNPEKPEPITRERWNAAKESLIAMGLLNKNGAITPRGKNAIGDKHAY
jgi:hypothetical protein